MRTKEVSTILKDIGWQLRTDDVGDKCADFNLPDRIANIIYGVTNLPNDQILVSTLSLTTNAFSSACADVALEYGKGTPLIISWSGLEIRTARITEADVKNFSNQAVAWAKEQDLDMALRDHAALPTNAPGSSPIIHLAALSLLGDVSKLKSYQTSFAAGDRLGFVPYITKDYIDRAVALSEQYAADPRPGLS